MSPSVQWISLGDALDHVVAHLHSPALAKPALRDALVTGKIAARAALCKSFPHRLPDTLNLKVGRAEPHVERDYYIGANLWRDLSIRWKDSSASRNQAREVKRSGTWGLDGRPVVTSEIFHSAIDMSGIVLSKSQVLAVWPSSQAADKPASGHRPKGTGFKVLDAPLLDEMRRLISAGSFNSATAAAVHVMKTHNPAGGGTKESKLRRLVDGYKLKFLKAVERN